MLGSGTRTSRLGRILSNFTPQVAAELPGPHWLGLRRESAAQALAGASLPTSEEEVWRYSRINDLELDRFAPVLTAAGGALLDWQLAPGLQNLSDKAALIVTSDGYVAQAEVDDSLAARGLRAGGAEKWENYDLLGSVAEPVDIFGQLNAAFAGDPVIVDIPPGMVIEQPIVIVHWLASNNAAVFPRIVIRSGEGSQATVCEYLVSSDITAFVAPVSEMCVGRASNLRYIQVQRLGTSVWQTAYSASTVDRDATLRSTAVALGGDYARVRTDSKLIGEGATAKLNAVYFGSGSQMHDFRTLQAHSAPKSTSDLLFKGAVGGSARSVYSGLIRVRKGAAGTNAFQTNRNLVLSQQAHADSVPNLEIEENDVRCSHASAVGPIDEDQLYYLESRGVPSDVATRLIILGFLGEILEELPLSALVDELRRGVASKLDSLAAVGASA